MIMSEILDFIKQRYEMLQRAEIVDLLPVDRPIKQPMTKFGGQPNWLETPEWPISKELGEPMRFIGQILLTDNLFPNLGGKMAYLFMTDDETGSLETWNAWAGENAVIIQPGGDNTKQTRPIATGPTVQTKKASIEYVVELVDSEEPPKEIEDEYEMMGDLYERINAIEDFELEYLWEVNKIGGIPAFIQEDELSLYEPEHEWLLILQLSEYQPFYLNFGDGIGYAFINKSGTLGRFFWQCT